MNKRIVDIIGQFYTDEARKFNKLDGEIENHILSLLECELANKHKKVDMDEVVTYLKGFHFEVVAYNGKPFTLHMIPGSQADPESIDSFDDEGIKYDESEYIDFGVKRIRTEDFDDNFYNAIDALNKCMLPIYYEDVSLSELYHLIVFQNSDEGLCDMTIDIYVDLPYLINMQDVSMETISNMCNNLKEYIEKQAEVTIEGINSMVINKNTKRLDILKRENFLQVMNAEICIKERTE